jgi:predicted anti-sigma-YlaC factor YlaD
MQKSRTSLTLISIAAIAISLALGVSWAWFWPHVQVGLGLLLGAFITAWMMLFCSSGGTIFLLTLALFFYLPHLIRDVLPPKHRE